MNYKEKQEVRKDQAILEHLVAKYGKSDVLQYINEGRFADFTRRVGRGISRLVRTFRDWAMDVVNFINSGSLPEGVAVVMAEDAAAMVGGDANNFEEIEKINQNIENDIAECEEFWDNYIAHANISESYINRLHRKHLNEAKFTPKGDFIKLESPEETKVKDINTKQLKREIMSRLRKRMKLGDNVKKEDVLLIWGAPGIGKTAIVNKMLLDLQQEDEAKRRMTLIDTRLASMDYDDFFLPAANRDERGKARERADIPATFLPVYKLGSDADNEIGNERANQHNGSEFGGVLFFDEFSRANRGVHQVLMKLIDERQLGEYRLGDRWSMIAAANRKVDMSDESDFSWEAAFARRFTQRNFVPTRAEWLDWAKTEGHIRSDIIDFIESYPDHWYEAIKSDEAMATGMTPAGWETVSAEWDDLEQFDPEWNELDDETRNEMKIDKLIGKSGIGIFRENQKGVEDDMDDYLNVFRNFPRSQCKKVWKDGENVDPKFVQSPGNIAQVVKAIFIERPGKDKNVLPTPEEYGKFLAFCMNLDDASKRQMAIENMKQILRQNVDRQFMPDMPKIGGKDNPYYEISKQYTSQMGKDFNKKGGRI